MKTNPPNSNRLIPAKVRNSFTAKLATLAVALAAFVILPAYPLWLGKGGWLRVWSIERQVGKQKDANARLRQRNSASMPRFAT